MDRGPAGSNGLCGFVDLEVLAVVAGDLVYAGLGVCEDVRGEIELGQREDDASAEGGIVSLQEDEQGLVEGLALVGGGGDGVDEVGTGVRGLVRAAEVGGDCDCNVRGKGAELEEVLDNGESNGADGVVALEEGQERWVGPAAVWVGKEAAEDGCGENAVGLRLVGQVSGELGDGGRENLLEIGLVGARVRWGEGRRSGLRAWRWGRERLRPAPRRLRADPAERSGR